MGFNIRSGGYYTRSAIPYIDLNSQTYTKLKDKGLYTSAAFITRKEELSPIIETFISLIIKDYKI